MTSSTFSVPIDDRYFEDYAEGSVFEFGPIAMEEAEIISFAESFDPQTMHTDPEKAAQGPFHGLIASGWHTIALMMRLFVDHYLSAVASRASPGVDEVRWYRPVRPGDRLQLRISILEAKPSRSKPDRGMVVSLLEGINQEGEVVTSLKAMNLLAKRG
ncbi:MAG: MaoC family dehydratase [Roseiarcus sp.]